MSIVVSNVVKSYGNQLALNNISFQAKKGEVIGFLGPNGAGKSTMMKMLTGFIPADKGFISVNGLDIKEKLIAVKKTIGYLPEHNPLYVDMFVREYLLFQAGIYKLKQESVEFAISQVGLSSQAHKKIGELSKGYQQRVGLAAAILHNPDVLILDEPTTGLDPNQLQEIRGLIKELGKEKTILFSTHIMQEVEAVCDRVIIINKGELLLDKRIEDIKQNNKQVLEVSFNYKIEEQFIKQLPNIVSFKNTFDATWLITFNSEKDMRPILFDFAQEKGLKILELHSKNEDLDSLFQKLTKLS